MGGSPEGQYGAKSLWQRRRHRSDGGFRRQSRCILHYGREPDGGRWHQRLERFRAKWIPVRVKKTRQNQNPEPRSDSIGTEKALVGFGWRPLWVKRVGLTTRRSLPVSEPTFVDRADWFRANFRPGLCGCSK